MGIGIAIDVSLATVGKFRDSGLSLKTWTIPIMLTHIGFPAFGYYLFWGLSEAFPAAELALGLIGFTLVTLFIYEAICGWVGAQPIFGISAFISKVFGLEDDDSRRFVAILAVSWDALWSGPAKAAQAIAGHWNDAEVLGSFLVAGLTVAVIAQTALGVAFLLRKVKFTNAKSLAKFSYYGKLVELSVIGGFGVLSGWQGVFGNGNLYQSIAVSAAVLLFVFTILRKPLMANDMEEAEEAIAGEV